MDKIIEIYLEFSEEGMCELIYLSHLDNNLYRVEDISSCVLGQLQYGDIIKIEPQDQNNFTFKQVVKPSEWRSEVFVLSKEMIEKDEILSLLNQIENLGGKWERVMGGVLSVCLPPNCDFDVKSAMNNVHVAKKAA